MKANLRTGRNIIIGLVVIFVALVAAAWLTGDKDLPFTERIFSTFKQTPDDTQPLNGAKLEEGEMASELEEPPAKKAADEAAPTVEEKVEETEGREISSEPEKVEEPEKEEKYSDKWYEY